MKQAMKDFIRGVVIGTGVLIALGSLGLSDSNAISLTECLIRCGIGMAMIAGAIWISRITHVHNRKKKAPRVAATTQEGQTKNLN